MAIKKSLDPYTQDIFYGAWNLEDYNWDLGQLGGEGRPDLGGGPGANIPLGPRSIPVFTSVPSLPTLVPAIKVPQAPQNPRPVIRQVQPPDPEDASEMPLNDAWSRGENAVIHGSARFHKQPDGTWYDNDPVMGGLFYPDLASLPRAGEQQVQGPWPPNPFPKEEQEEMALDLGDLLGQLGSAYINTRYAPVTTQPVNFQPSYGTGGTNGGIPATPAVGIPFYDLVPEGQVGVCPPRKRRRRRRRLATVSDIKDIAASKSLMGPALLKTWIATHSR